MENDGEKADTYRKLGAHELAGYVLGFQSFPTSDRKATKEEQFRQWWRSFIEGKRGMSALKTFEAARLKAPKRSQESVNSDLSTLLRIALACHGAITWNKQRDPGSRYRVRVSGARRQRQNLAYHARQLAIGFEGYPPGLSWALRGAAVQAGVGSIRDKLRKEIDGLPPNVSQAERQATVKELRLDEERSYGTMWTDFFDELAKALRNRLPEIDGGPWLRLFTFGNLHYSKRIEGKLPATETMLAFELTFHLRRWSLGQAHHGWSSASPMSKGGKPHNDVAASFINAALELPRGLTGEQIGNRLKRLPKDVGLIAWPEDDG